MNKKGSIDNALIPVYLFMIAIAVWVAYTILNTGSAAFASDPTASALVSNSLTMISRMGNNGFALMAFGLIIFNMLGAFLLFTHPIFVIIDVLFMPISILLSAILSNAYEVSIYTLPNASVFVVMNFIMLNLPYLIVVADIATAILAYALVKNR